MGKKTFLDRYTKLNGWLTLSAISVGVYSVSIPRRAYAATVFVYAEALFQIAYAVAFLVYHHIRLLAARYTDIVRILTESRRADTIAVFVANLAFPNRAYLRWNWIAADNRVPTISWETFAYHGPDRAGVQDFTLGVNTAW